jgi:hypothetical protein
VCDESGLLYLGEVDDLVEEEIDRGIASDDAIGQDGYSVRKREKESMTMK